MKADIKNLKRKRLRVFGIVQSVGFRPFVSLIADRSGVAGSVCNKGPYVEIFIEGTTESVEEFQDLLINEAPPRSSILKVEEKEEEPLGEDLFRIIESEKVKGDVFVSPDIAICNKCKEEMFDPHNKRYLHPFINCTACGPRLTILDSMPYDRVRTSMGEFPMCPDCEKEYLSKETRRYHAEPTCCNECGPELSVIYDNGRFGKRYEPTDYGDDNCSKSENDRNAVKRVREVIRLGGIAAIKGIGGFHLCCDASNEEAVRRLRELKSRPFKPFALMLKDMDTVRRECVVPEGLENVLEGPKKPILLLKRSGRPDSVICPSAAPDNPNIGVMLPYAPVHLLIFDLPDGEKMTDCLIMTSGNPKGAPICKDGEEAVKYLGSMCDIILSNNRKIRLRADDTVMSWYNGPYMIRRSRGYAPLPVMTDNNMKGAVLGIGGELKNTFCLAKDDLYYMSPYIGDMGDIRSVDALKEAVKRMEELLETEPGTVCADMHPLYNSSAVAKQLGLPVLEIQHHYAHVLSCMAENNIREKVIGVSFDGTGYGTDGTIWGGEFLVSGMEGFERAASIAPFRQSGGDAAAREGWRIAVSLLRDSLGDDKAREFLVSHGIVSEDEYNNQSMLSDSGINTVMSTSMGRVFDAASAVLGLRRENTCEGEASMVLQFAAESSGKESGELKVRSYLGQDRYIRQLPEDDNGRPVFRMDILIGNLARGIAAGEDPAELAYVFHRAVSYMICDACEMIRMKSGIPDVALTGGVMQNTLLLGMTEEALKEKEFNVIRHRLIPPNDGGIGLGQAYYAMNHINSMKGE